MEALIAVVALTAMEIVLGIDNIVFIAILVDRLPSGEQPKARILGLVAAMMTRILLLVCITWIMRLTSPVFALSHLGIPEAWVAPEVNEVSWRDLILLAGGLFLVSKSVHEIHERVEGDAGAHEVKRRGRFLGVVGQIAILDIIFSLDSVITAVGMANQLWIMILAIVLAVGVMMMFSGVVSGFIQRHPTLKMLALSFLILIGVMLVAEAVGTPVNKGYIYFAMAFALAVEILNLTTRSREEPQPTTPA
jgi:predicted tellurium resistance membrane protein TerC